MNKHYTIKPSYMKKLLQIPIINLILFTSIFAQSPDVMSYQAVIRDSDGNIFETRR
jgi:hypothetical protein